MRTVPLTVTRKAVLVRDAGGRAVTLLQPRIVCTLFAGPQRIKLDAWIDTGSPVTLLPHRSWVWFERHVRWLDPFGGGVSVTVGGGSGVFRRGEIGLVAASSDARVELPSLTVTAFFAPDNGTLKHALIGLTGGVLAGRRLVVEPDLASARLEAA